jgi:hypothetical protein
MGLILFVCVFVFLVIVIAMAEDDYRGPTL